MAGVIIRRVIKSSAAPAAIGPYSQAVQVDQTLYVSGQLGLDAQTGVLVPGGVVPEAHQALQNIGHILEAAGAKYSNVVKATVLLADMADFGAVNEVYSQYFSEPYPARAAFQVAALPRGGRVEIEAVAVVGEVENAQAHI